MMKVWTDNVEAGLFDGNGERGSTFAYLPNLLAERAVSVTLPVRLASWSLHYGLPPIFEMNLPEGYLRERLRLAFAKATGTEFSRSAQVNEDAERLFLLIALNCALRNGDAHLKNFGVTYDDVQGETKFAPVYDLVTTTVYLSEDRLALTLNGSTNWPVAKELCRLGEARTGASPAKIRRILERIDQAIQETVREVRAYGKEHPEFAEIGERLLREWESGSRASLRAA